MPRIPCSELAGAIHDLAIEIGAQPGMNSLDQVVAEMNRDIPLLTKERVVDAIVEATQTTARQQSDVQEQLAALRREARDLKRAGTKPAPQANVGLSRAAQELAKYFVAQGVTDRNALVDAVHAEMPEMSRREVADAISGYGQYRELSKDEVDQTLRDLKGQLQQVAKLEDMAAGKAPLKTGQEHRTPSDEERRLIREVNEAKKAGGFQVTDPARQLRTALDGIKRRLGNQIKDLEAQIAKGAKFIRVRRAAPRDAEVDALIEKRDTLKKQFDAMFGEPGLTDEQRIANARRNLEKTIAEYERRLETGDTSSRARPSRTPETPELAALRERSKAVRSEYGQSEPVRYQRVLKSIAEAESKLKELKALPKLKPRAVLSKRLERAEFDRNEIRRAIRRKLAELKPRSVWGAGAAPLSAARAIMASMDFSAVLRQGGMIAFGHPFTAARALGPMLKALSPRQADAEMRRIYARESAPRMAHDGLHFSDPNIGGTVATEEIFRSRLIDKLPGIRQGVQASGRAFTVFLNRLRADTYDAMTATLSRNGEATETEGRAIANYINVATGYGSLGRFSAAADAVNSIFFAPRYLASRFQLLTLEPVLGKHGGTLRTRRLILQEYARTAIGLGLTLALAHLAGADIKMWPPDDPDFLKIRVGNTRIDLFFGLQQIIRFGAREAVQARKTIRGEPRRFKESGGYIAWDFLRTKFSPLLAIPGNILSGETAVHEPVTLKGELFSVLPMAGQDIYETMREHELPAATALALLSILGAGVQTYGDRKPGRRRATRPRRPRRRPREAPG